METQREPKLITPEQLASSAREKISINGIAEPVEVLVNMKDRNRFIAVQVIGDQLFTDPPMTERIIEASSGHVPRNTNLPFPPHQERQEIIRQIHERLIASEQT